MAVMKMHMEVRKLTTKINFKNSLEPQTGSSSFPIKRRPRVLTTTYYTSERVNLITGSDGVQAYPTIYNNSSNNFNGKRIIYPMYWLFNVTGRYEVPDKRNRPTTHKSCELESSCEPLKSSRLQTQTYKSLLIRVIRQSNPITFWLQILVLLA